MRIFFFNPSLTVVRMFDKLIWHSNYRISSVIPGPSGRKVRRMSVQRNISDDALKVFLFLVSEGAGLREQRRMKREMAEHQHWKEGRNLCDNWIFRET